MTGASTVGQGSLAGTMFDRLIAHEQGLPEASAPTLRPRLPYAFQHSTDADAEISTEEVIIPLRPPPTPAAVADDGASGSEPTEQEEAPVQAAPAQRSSPADAISMLPHASPLSPLKDFHEDQREAFSGQPLQEARLKKAVFSEAAQLPQIATSNAVQSIAPSEPSRPQPNSTPLQPPVPRAILPLRAAKGIGRDETVVEIHIGRIDVRAAAEFPPQSRSTAPASRTGDNLAQYLDRRSRGARS
jgi:hypothetical protein